MAPVSSGLRRSRDGDANAVGAEAASVRVRVATLVMIAGQYVLRGDHQRTGNA